MSGDGLNILAHIIQYVTQHSLLLSLLVFYDYTHWMYALTYIPLVGIGVVLGAIVAVFVDDLY